MYGAGVCGVVREMVWGVWYAGVYVGVLSICVHGVYVCVWYGCGMYTYLCTVYISVGCDVHMACVWCVCGKCAQHVCGVMCVMCGVLCIGGCGSVSMCGVHVCVSMCGVGMVCMECVRIRYVAFVHGAVFRSLFHIAQSRLVLSCLPGLDLRSIH